MSRSRVFGGIAAASFFAVAFVGVLTLMHGRDAELEAILARTRGEHVRVPLAPAEADYQVEARRGSEVVPMRIADLSARVVFVNFWATFCPPCIEELPSLLALARSRSPDQMVVLAVSYDDSWDVIDEFLKKLPPGSIPPGFVVVRDPSHAAGHDLKALFGTEKLPETWIVRDGTVEVMYVSSRDWAEPDFAALVDRMLAK